LKNDRFFFKTQEGETETFEKCLFLFQVQGRRKF